MSAVDDLNTAVASLNTTIADLTTYVNELKVGQADQVPSTVVEAAVTGINQATSAIQALLPPKA